MLLDLFPFAFSSESIFGSKVLKMFISSILYDSPEIEEMDSDEDEDAGPMVTIGVDRVPYNSVTSDMVAAMMPLEKEEYIRIGQQLYENMYDWC